MSDSGKTTDPANTIGATTSTLRDTHIRAVQTHGRTPTAAPFAGASIGVSAATAICARAVICQHTDG